MKIFIIAGEASGDKLGGEIMRYLNELMNNKIIFQGIGGARMEEQGLRSLFPMDELSVMGIAEILEKYVALRRRITQTVDQIVSFQPDIVLTIDIPEFSLRVAKAVRRKMPNVHMVHYGAPSVWAWRPGRANHMAKFIDQVLALFPFEPPYMQAAGMRCDFVGHPVVTEPIASADEAAQFRRIYNIADRSPILALMPGSRSSEVKRLGVKFRETALELKSQKPDLELIVPTTFSMAGDVTEIFKDDADTFHVVDPRDMSKEQAQVHKRAALRASDVALAASGTVSLELAAAQTPMVIAYDMNWLSRFIIPRLLRIDTVTLVNLVSDTRDVPECIARECTVANMTKALASVFNAPDAQLRAMDLTMRGIGLGGAPPGLRAARAVLDGYNSRSELL